MVDGKISPGEWDDATSVPLTQDFRLLAKQHGSYVLLAVVFPAGKDGIVDLYLSLETSSFSLPLTSTRRGRCSPEPGKIFDFHASAKLGELELHDGKWPEWQWWNNKDWVANVSRVDSFSGPRFLPENVREFQILRSRFPETRWLIHLKPSIADGHGNFAAIEIPAKTSDTDATGWLSLRLH